MINIDFLTLKAFLRENIDFIIGARIQKIQQPTRKDFIFYLRNNSTSRKLYININPEIYHIAFMNSHNEIRRNIKIPKQPPMFCMLLRKYLDGAKISDALVIENERILELHIDTVDEFGQIAQLCLCTELMGKHSNIILYNRQDNIIIGCAHNVGPEKSCYRELKGGLKYIYPPSHALSLSNELKSQFLNLSENEIENYLSSDNYSPAVLNDKYTLFKDLLPDSIPYDSVNSMLDDYYSSFQKEFIVKIAKNRLSSTVFAKLKKTENSINKIQSTLKKRNNSDKYKLYGELLTSYLYMKADFVKNITVFDYINNLNITIELDENKTMKENAQKYFKLYTKAKNTKEKSENLLNKLFVEKKYLENLLYNISSATDICDLDDIEQELYPTESKHKKQEKPTITKVNINGFEVFIGKNNKQNDYIISKLANDEDYWFHTKLCAGSHVLLKASDKEPDENTIFECCKIARQYSSAELPSKVGVIYTKRKFLKKPPASPPGYVTYKNEKEILI